jgi:hypothetical protein
MPTYTDLQKPITPYENESKAIAESGFLLQENGDYLLQEDGSRILLNYPGGYDRSFKPNTEYTSHDKPTTSYQDEEKIQTEYTNINKPS